MKSQLKAPFPEAAGAEEYQNPQEFAWLQDEALDLLQARTSKHGTFPSACAVYYAAVIAASDAQAEPAPGHDGKPFQCSIARLALHSNQPAKEVRLRLADFVRFDLLDTFVPPEDNMMPTTLRLRTVILPVASAGQVEEKA
jgi:hypothetical protein